MRFVVKLITCYIEISILFAQIDFILLILISLIKIAVSNRYRTNDVPVASTDVITDEPENERIPTFTIQAKEQWHIAKDNLGKWHIGLVIEIVDWNDSIVLCVDVLVSASLFFRFPLQKAKQYLIEMAEDNQDVIILAADLQYNIVGVEFQINDMYDLPDLPVIIKTYWIRIIQRTWKRVYAERMCRLKLRGGLKAQRQFELTGNYGGPSVVGLRGMLRKKHRR